jgi:hypothetical protein
MTGRQAAALLRRRAKAIESWAAAQPTGAKLAEGIFAGLCVRKVAAAKTEALLSAAMELELRERIEEEPR